MKSGANMQDRNEIARLAEKGVVAEEISIQLDIDQSVIEAFMPTAEAEISDDTKIAIVEMHDADNDKAEIAEAEISDDTKIAIVEMYDADNDKAEIAEDLGITVEAVQSVLDELE